MGRAKDREDAYWAAYRSACRSCKADGNRQLSQLYVDEAMDGPNGRLYRALNSEHFRRYRATPEGAAKIRSYRPIRDDALRTYQRRWMRADRARKKRQAATVKM